MWAFRLLLGLTVVCLLTLGHLIVCMPGRSFHGELRPLTGEETPLRDELRRHVEMLAGQIGERTVFKGRALDAAADYIESELRAVGYAVERQEYPVFEYTACNLEASLPGTVRPEEILVVGAHYDSAPDCPGADDNGSAVAALLALARRCAGRPVERTIRFVVFANEEPPLFQMKHMGSLVYAQRCRAQHEKVLGMLSLETVGYYSETAGSQDYPAPLSWLYPSRGNFIAFVGSLPSRTFLCRVVGSFRRNTLFPSEGVALPSAVPESGWSDHWSFWQQGYPAIMVTDTAPFRYPYYHTREDTADKLDYDRLARVVAGLERVLRELAGARPWARLTGLSTTRGRYSRPPVR
jgi:hypothetical protein